MILLKALRATWIEENDLEETPLYHGTRNLAHVTRRGLRPVEAAGAINSDVFTYEEPDRRGLDEPRIEWRPYLKDWWASLDRPKRAQIRQTLGEPIKTVDDLAGHVGLVWAHRDLSVAQAYAGTGGNGGVVQFHPKDVHALGYFVADEASRKGERVFVVPLKSPLMVHPKHLTVNPKTAHQAMSEAVRKAVRDDPPNQEATEFTTGSTAEGLSFDEAARRMHGAGHARFRALATEVDQALGLTARHRHAIGDTAEWGSEPALVSEIAHAPDWETVRYSAAWKGRHGNQKAVLPFLEDPTGSDHLYTLDVPHTHASLPQVRQALDTAGLPYRTFVPHGASTRVMVYHHHAFDPENTTEQKLATLGGSYGQDITRHTGRGEFLGGETRAEGLRAFRQVIDAHERRSGTRRYTPRPGVHSDRAPAHSERLAASRALAKSYIGISGWLSPTGESHEIEAYPNRNNHAVLARRLKLGPHAKAMKAGWIRYGEDSPDTLFVELHTQHPATVQRAIRLIAARGKDKEVWIDDARALASNQAGISGRFPTHLHAIRKLREALGPTQKSTLVLGTPLAKAIHVKGFIHESGRKTSWRTDGPDGMPWHTTLSQEQTGHDIREQGKHGWASWGVDLDGVRDTLAIRVPGPRYGGTITPGLATHLSNLIHEWAPRVKRVEVDERYGPPIKYGTPDEVLEAIKPEGWTPPAPGAPAATKPRPSRARKPRRTALDALNAGEQAAPSTATLRARVAPPKPRRKAGVRKVIRPVHAPKGAPKAASRLVLAADPLRKAADEEFGTMGFIAPTGEHHQHARSVYPAGVRRVSHDALARTLGMSGETEAISRGFIRTSHVGGGDYINQATVDLLDTPEARTRAVRWLRSITADEVYVDLRDPTLAENVRGSRAFNDFSAIKHANRNAAVRFLESGPAAKSLAVARLLDSKTFEPIEGLGPRNDGTTGDAWGWTHHEYALHLVQPDGAPGPVAGRLHIVTNAEGLARVGSFEWDRSAWGDRGVQAALPGEGVRATRTALRSAFQNIKARGFRVHRVSGTRVSGAKDRAVARGTLASRRMERPLVLKSIRGIVSPAGAIHVGDDEATVGLIHAHLFRQAKAQGNWRDQGWIRFIHGKGPGGDLGIEYQGGNPVAERNAAALVQARGAQRRIFLDRSDAQYDVTSSVHTSVESALGSIRHGGAPIEPASTPDPFQHRGGRRRGVRAIAHTRAPAWAPKAASRRVTLVLRKARVGLVVDEVLHRKAASYLATKYGVVRPKDTAMTAGWIDREGRFLGDDGDHNNTAIALLRHLGKLTPDRYRSEDWRTDLRDVNRLLGHTGLIRFSHVTRGYGGMNQGGDEMDVEFLHPPTPQQLQALRGVVARHRPAQFHFDHQHPGTGAETSGEGFDRFLAHVGAAQKSRGVYLAKAPAHHPVWARLDAGPGRRFPAGSGRRFAVAGKADGHIWFKPKGQWMHVNPHDADFPTGQGLDSLEAHLAGRAARRAAPPSPPPVTSPLHAVALREFGETADEREAGYILPDGRLLDFSGKREGGPSGTRNYDHRAIGRLMWEDPGSDSAPGLVSSGTDGMIEFMHRAAAARVHVGTDGISVDSAHPLTEAQARHVVRWARQRRVGLVVDYSDEYGDTKNSATLPRPTVEAVHRVFRASNTVQRSRAAMGFFLRKAAPAVEAPPDPARFPVFATGLEDSDSPTASTTPLFVSGLAAHLARKMPKQAPLDQVRGLIWDAKGNTRPEVKKDEVIWSGIEMLLNDNEAVRNLSVRPATTFPVGSKVWFHHQGSLVPTQVTGHDEAGWLTTAHPDRATLDPLEVVSHNGKNVPPAKIDRQKLLGKLAERYRGRVQEVVLGGGGAAAQGWDDLESASQDQIERHWMDRHREDVLESEVTNWWESDEPTFQARQALIGRGSPWLQEQFKQWVNDEDWWAQGDEETGMSAGQRPPFHADDPPADAFTLDLAEGVGEYDLPDRNHPWYGSRGVAPRIDPERLPWQDPDMLGADPRQAHLPLDLPPADLPARRAAAWKKWEPDFHQYIAEALEKELETAREGVEAPDSDYFDDTVQESLGEQWGQLEDDDRFSYAVDHDLLDAEAVGDAGGPKWAQYQLPWAEQPAAYREHLFTVPAAKVGVVESGHYRTPNIAVHARVSHRTIPDLGKTTFIEEIQSDAMKQKAAIPFTKDYHELPMKRLLRLAVDRGDDALAWTSGAQQVARWENAMRRVVQKIEWEPTDEDGTYGRLSAYDHSGNRVIEKDMGHTELAEHIGKTAAQTLLAAPLERTMKHTRSLTVPEGVETVWGLAHRIELDQLPGTDNGTLAVYRNTRADGSAEMQMNAQYLNAEDMQRVLGNTRHDPGPGQALHARLLAQPSTVVPVSPGSKGRRTLMGSDFVVGGQKFVEVYDEKMPAFATKHTKRWGGRVESMDMDPHFSPNRRGETPGMVHVLRITPAMREALKKEPQMLFSRRGQGGLFLKAAGAPRRMAPMALVSGVRPNDDPSWADTFAYIEREHVSADPAYWRAFLGHVQQHGVRTPVVILREGNQRRVISGHHRVWAAVKHKLPSIPVIETQDRGQAARWRDAQAARESDWRRTTKSRRTAKSTLPNRIPGGKADKARKKPEDFDPEKVAEGARIEREHTSSQAIAEEIARDHLTEDPEYYRKLKRVEKSGWTRARAAYEALRHAAAVERARLTPPLVPVVGIRRA